MNIGKGRNKLSLNSRGASGRPVATGGRRSTSACQPPDPLESNKSLFFKTHGFTKLADASRAFSFDFKDKVVLDIGSSTGGFTAFALEAGAKKVIAVEKGTRQMMPGIAVDPRVELHEKTDIFDFKPTGAVDVILADISFLSLTKVLMYARLEIAQPATRFLVMLKPQFEAEAWQLNRGVVKNEKMRREILKKFEMWLRENGFLIVAKHDNELTGRSGNRERFYYLKSANVAPNFVKRCAAHSTHR